MNIDRIRARLSITFITAEHLMIVKFEGWPDIKMRSVLLHIVKQIIKNLSISDYPPQALCRHASVKSRILCAQLLVMQQPRLSEGSSWISKQRKLRISQFLSEPSSKIIIRRNYRLPVNPSLLCFPI